MARTWTQPKPTVASLRTALGPVLTLTFFFPYHCPFVAASWNRAPQIGSWTHVTGTWIWTKPSLGLEPTWAELEPSQNSAWDVNPRGWDSNPAKTHSTWFQHIMKLRFLMSYHRKNSVRDKGIGKKWVYSDLERGTLYRENVGHGRGRVQTQNAVWLVFMVWVFRVLMIRGSLQLFLGKRGGCQASTPPWSFVSALELSWHRWLSHSACWLRVRVSSESTRLPSSTHLMLNCLLCPWPTSSFESCALPLFLLLLTHSVATWLEASCPQSVSWEREAALSSGHLLKSENLVWHPETSVFVSISKFLGSMPNYRSH